MEQRDVDLLITGADVLTFDDADTVLRDGAVAIAGNSIVWLGTSGDAGSRIRAKDTLNASGMIAMPGLVDCHVHTAQQFLRGKLASLGYIGSLREPIWKRYLIPFESGLEPEDVYCSGLAAYSSMISCGTTTFLEAGGPWPDEMGRAAEEIGIRGRIAMSTMDIDETLPKGFRFSTDEALQRSEALVKRWENHARVNAWLALRQIIVNSERLRLEMDALARQLNTHIHTHLCEGTYEVDYTIDNFGMRPAEYLNSIGVLNDRLHCAHPLLSRIFGYDDRTVFVTVTILCFLPAFVFASAGLRASPPMAEEYFFVQGAGRWNRLWRLALPAALPNLAVALRVLSVQSVLAALIAEFLMQTGGLGLLIATSTADLAMDQALAASLIGILIALALYATASAVERAALKWSS